MTGRREKAERYRRIRDQARELVTALPGPISRMSTLAALLHHKMPGFSWTGFYLLEGGELVVGPYQGLVACPVLETHRGVCWAGVLRNEPVIVPDVHAFPGHIACDSRSRSEIVVPVRRADGAVAGVLDVDSTRPDWFDETDSRGSPLSRTSFTRPGRAGAPGRKPPMKQACRTLAALALLAFPVASLPVAAYVIGEDAIIVEIPFPFSSGKLDFPAGTYRVGHRVSQFPSIQLDSLDGQTKVPLLAVVRLSRSRTANAREAALVFEKIGEKLHLLEVWLPSRDGFRMRSPKKEHEQVVVDAKLEPTSP